jgi:hypothetical protein
MRAKLAALCFTSFAGAVLCSAQTTPQIAALTAQPEYSQVYCSGFISDTKVPDDSYLISGEESHYKITFARGDYVYINRGQDKGVKVGDRYSVVRAITDPNRVEWFKSQNKLMKAMGTLYSDRGQVRVVNVQPTVSIAEVVFSCDYMQRADILRPLEDRPAPPFKDVSAFDHFAPVSGKPVGTIVNSNDFRQTTGRGSTIYVNLGVSQGLKVGDYLRVFRYQGMRTQTAPLTKGYQYQIYGFGSTPKRYEWKDLPREVLGEGVVLNTTRNAGTVLLTYSSFEIYPGDYVEIE